VDGLWAFFLKFVGGLWALRVGVAFFEVCGRFMGVRVGVTKGRHRFSRFVGVKVGVSNFWVNR